MGNVFLPPMSYTNPLLLVSPDELHNQGALDALISGALSLTDQNTTLFIEILADYNELDKLIRDLVVAYDTARHFNDADDQIHVDVLYGDNYLEFNWSIVLKSEETQTSLNTSSHTLESLPSGDHFTPGKPVSTGLEHVYRGSCNTVAVGGTFDHLHDGHKILLTASAFLAKKRLIVGVTGTELLKGKKYAEFLESYEDRVKSVLGFIKLLDKSLRVDVFKINDVCGPTASEEDIDGLVVSLETASGGDYVNSVRKAKGYRQLTVYKICVVGGSPESEGYDDKLSSTRLRKMDYEKSVSSLN